MTVQKGDIVFDDAFGVKSFRTEEDLTITVDPGVGTDPTEPYRFSRQDQIDAHGSFNTIAAAVAVLPNEIAHQVRIEISDGTHTLPSTGFGALSRFDFILEDATTLSTLGTITFASVSGLVTTAGTSTYAVTGSTGNVVTFASDPGFGADDHQGRFMRVASGTGAGQYKPIRTHAGTSFTTAGLWSPVLDGTSVVEIVQPGTVMQTSTNTSFLGVGIGGQSTVATVGFVFDALDIVHTGGNGTFYFKNGSFRPQGGTRFIGAQLWLVAANLLIGECIIDGLGTAPNFSLASVGLVNIQAGVMRTSSTTIGWLLRGSQCSGVNALGPVGGDVNWGLGSTVRLQGGAIDDCAFSAVYIRYRGALVWFNQTRSSGNGEYGVDMAQGAQALINDATDYVTTPLDGSLGEVLMDGNAVTYAEIDGASDKTVATLRGTVFSQYDA
jgi:hypothetical protein